MADSNSVALRQVEESVYGVTPATPTFKNLRFVDESLKVDPNFTKSKEIRSDGQISDSVRTGWKIMGGINGELSHGAYDDIFRSVLRAGSSWEAAISVGPLTTISFTAATQRISDSASGFGSMTVGSWINVSGATNAENNGLFKITEVDAGGAYIVVTNGDNDLVDESAAASITVKQGTEITNGVTLPSWSIEKEWTDLSNVFSLITGFCYGSFNLDIDADGIVTISFSGMGKDEEGKTATTASSTTAATTDEVMNSVDDVTRVISSDADLDIHTLSFGADSKLREKKIVGNLGLKSIGKSRFEAGGNFQVYFEDAVMYNKFLANTKIDLSIIFVKNGDTYIFDLPSLRITKAERITPGTDTDVMGSFDFDALMDPTELKTMRIVSFPAA